MRPKPNKIIFWISVYIFRCFCKIYFRGASVGHENYPSKGPFLIAMNHNSIMDIPAMALAVDRPVFTMVKASLFHIPILSWWMRNVGFFPVHRGAGDRRAIDYSREVLRRGHVLIMAPEGTRRRRTPVRPTAHTGIVRLAQEFHCPIVPVGVIGTRKILPPEAKFPHPHKLKVIVGEPMVLEPVEVTPKNQDKLQEQADRIMDRVYELSGENFD